MKKIYLISLLLLFYSLNGYCQYQLGIKGGYNYSGLFDWTKQSSRYSSSYITNHNSSVLALVIKSGGSQSRMAFEVSYLSNSFGVKANWSKTPDSHMVDYNFDIGYLNFMLAPEFGLGSESRFYLKPGFYLGKLVNSSVTGVKTTIPASSSVKIDSVSGSAADLIFNTLFGLQLGIGCEIPLRSNISLYIENNYTTNLGTISEVWNASRITILNVSLTLGVSYKFSSSARR